MARKPGSRNKQKNHEDGDVASFKDHDVVQHQCLECSHVLKTHEKALFVEEEAGRIFCSESCIVNYFAPEIEKFEKKYQRLKKTTDLSAGEREKLTGLRWESLSHPDEIWAERASSGDHRYTLVKSHRTESDTVYSVSVCLMLRGEPSFLFIAFLTRDVDLVSAFRVGESLHSLGDLTPKTDSSPSDRLASPWESIDGHRAEVHRLRAPGDIPESQFLKFQKWIEPTLQAPNELWTYKIDGKTKGYHFIKYVLDPEPFWYVVIAKDAVDASQIEIVDAFPTRDAKLKTACERGKQEVIPLPQDVSASAGTDTVDPLVKRHYH